MILNPFLPPYCPYGTGQSPAGIFLSTVAAKSDEDKIKVIRER
jgi:hypothetical protein